MNIKKVFFIGTSVILMILLTIGVSYSMWSITNEQSGTDVIDAGCFEITFTENSSAINLSGAAAVQNTDAEAESNLTPYSFTITNTCDLNSAYTVNLKSTSDSTLPAKYVRVKLTGSNNSKIGFLTDSNVYTESTISETYSSVTYTKNYALASGVLGPKGSDTASITYNLRAWLSSGDVDVSVKEINDLVFNFKIFIANVPTSEVATTNYPTLANAILSENISKGTASIKSAVTDENSGLYEAEDDYGTSYYFRGLKSNTNNHVIFNGMCWQIIRINGDSTVRLIYNGTPTNGTCTTDNTVYTTSQFNSSYDSPTYVGYMYTAPTGSKGVYYTRSDGTTITTTPGASLLEARTNTTSSSLKKTIDGFYETYFKDKDAEDYLADVGFCGDRNLYDSVGNGYSTNSDTRYGAWGRMYNERNNSTLNPTYKCALSNDLYTTSTASNGNKALKYPIGTLTADEAMYAGLQYYQMITSDGNTDGNKNIWLVNTSSHYWTMSPSYFDASWGNARGWRVNSGGYLIHWWGVNGSYGARPVINLKSDALISGGIGSKNNPYVVDTTSSSS